MNIKIVFALFMIGLITEGHTQLYCYVCNDCPDGNNLSDEYLISCSEDETTSQPISSTETSVTPIDVTTSPTNSTPELSTNVISSSTELSTTQSSIEPTTETTTVLTTIANTEPITVPSPQNTNPSSMEPITEPIVSTITVPGSPITTTSATPGTENTFATAELSTETNPIELPSTTGRPIETPPSASMLRRSLLKQSEHNCYVLVNETQHTNRGCVAASPNQNEMCRKANENILPAECRVCATDKCNSSSRMVLSVLLLFSSICAILSL